MQLDQNRDNQALGKLIAQRITESSDFRITFAEYMECVLYHPQHGYYATAPSKIGATGDFVTSPHLGADFGELLAEQLVQMSQFLQPYQRFTVVEMGAGQGLLAGDMVAYMRDRHPEFFAKLDYVIIERAAALVQEQQQQLRSLLQAGAPIRWTTLEAIAPNSITGCFLSNELVDALPVHQIIRQDGKLQEIYVSLADPAAIATEQTPVQLTETIGELSTLRIKEYFEQIGIDLTTSRYPEGYRSEVNLAAIDWITAIAQRLDRGYVLTIDYGYPSDRYYHPVRSEGTLQCYYQHRHHSDPYQHLGYQDITAHVDFTALERYGEACGLQTVGFTKQGLLLMALGMGDRLAAVGQSNSTDPQAIQIALQRRDALQALINPMGLGNFGVLIQQKGVQPSAPLKGLQGEV